MRWNAALLGRLNATRHVVVAPQHSVACRCPGSAELWAVWVLSGCASTVLSGRGRRRDGARDPTGYTVSDLIVLRRPAKPKETKLA